MTTTTEPHLPADATLLAGEWQDLGSEELLVAAWARFAPRIALASSFGAEDQVVLDMLCRHGEDVRVFTLDTGRLPQETFDVIAATQKRYGVQVEVYAPAAEDIEALVREGGVNLFYDSLAGRKQCCEVRKVRPLRRALAGLDAWATGLRREQAATRGDLQRVAWDKAHGLVKLSPLADWSAERVWAYIRAHGVPYNALHDRGYPSIGCAPCTRAVEPGADIRSGRWWWEAPEHKECGLHWDEDPKDPAR